MSAPRIEWKEFPEERMLDLESQLWKAAKDRATLAADIIRLRGCLALIALTSVAALGLAIWGLL